MRTASKDKAAPMKAAAVLLTLLALPLATSAAQPPEPTELVGANARGVRVVYSPQPWQVCQVGVGTGLIFYLQGDQITEIWPHQRCTFEQREDGKLQFSCVSDDGPRYSFSQAVFVQDSAPGQPCSYVCKSGCSDFVPKRLDEVPMTPMAPPMPPPPES